MHCEHAGHFAGIVLFLAHTVIYFCEFTFFARPLPVKSRAKGVET